MIERGNRKVRDGRVITKGGDKTIGVMVERRVRHALYGKEVKVSKKVMVHDEENKANIGDTVRVMETRPISKSKRWRLVEIIAEATK
jgi:small subunit ribosomal protein S17